MENMCETIDLFVSVYPVDQLDETLGEEELCEGEKPLPQSTEYGKMKRGQLVSEINSQSM